MSGNRAQHLPVSVVLSSLPSPGSSGVRQRFLCKVLTSANSSCQLEWSLQAAGLPFFLVPALADKTSPSHFSPHTLTRLFTLQQALWRPSVVSRVICATARPSKLSYRRMTTIKRTRDPRQDAPLPSVLNRPAALLLSDVTCPTVWLQYRLATGKSKRQKLPRPAPVGRNRVPCLVTIRP